MSKRRTERLLSIVVLLRSTRRYLTAEEIRSAVLGYPEADESFKRMFERDKEELRELGVPLETGLITPLDDEVGYRISEQDYELPEIRLEADEAAMLGLATRVWESAQLTGAAAGAAMKTGVLGLDAEDESEADAAGLLGIEPKLTTQDPAFGPLWQAVRDHRPVTFTYRAAGRAEATERVLEPWGVVNRRGLWYVAGHDRGRDGTRVFRMSRIEGPVKMVGPKDSVTVPAGTDVRGLVKGWDSKPPRGESRPARLRVRAGTGHMLRRRAEGPPAAAGAGWDEITVRYQPDWYVGYLASFGPDVRVVEPPELRDAVIRQLKGALASHSAPEEPAAPGGAGDTGAANAEDAAGAASRPAMEEPRMVTSADRLRRLLALVPYATEHPDLPTDETARKLGMKERELRDELSLVWCVELKAPDPYCPIDLSFEGGRFSISEAESIDRPLRLDRDEASVLLVALRMFMDLTQDMPAEREAVLRTIAKLEDAAGVAAEASTQVAVVDFVRKGGDPAALGTVATGIRTALATHKRVHLSYYVPGRDEVTERDVDPIRLPVVAGYSYLEGWCRRAEDVRFFRLDRILDLSVLDVPRSVPENVEPADVRRGLFRPSESDQTIELVLSAEARWVAEYYPCERVKDLGEGRLQVVLRTPDTQWVRRLALRLGEAARVVRPGELAGEVREAATAALASYEEPEKAE